MKSSRTSNAKRRDTPLGIRRTSTSWQVFAKIDGKFRAKRFPLGTALDTLKKERQRLIGRVLDDRAADDPDATTFTEDAATYLGLVEAMPSYADRRYRIQQWVREFTGRTRGSITARQIRDVLERWRKTKDHTPATLNQYRTALMHLYTTLDGKSAPNIVKDVPRFSEAYSAVARAWPMSEALQLIEAMPNSDTKIRLRVLLWTGWPSALLKAVKAGDINWRAKRVRLAPRQKGEGMVEAWVPILAPAVKALKAYKARALWGGFSNSSLHKSLQRAVRRAGSPRPLRVYDLRHTFGTWAAAHLKDDKALAELLRTQSIARYTRQAVAGRLEDARKVLGVAVATSGAFSPVAPRRQKKPTRKKR